MLDYTYLLPYDAGQGFKVRVDAVLLPPSCPHATPANPGFVRVLHSVHPPAGLYLRGDPSATHMVRETDWESSTLRCQRFKDSYTVYSGTSFTPNLCVILDVRVAVMRKGTFVLEPLAWGILPVLDAPGEGYVRRGAFVVPLFEGTPNPTALEALQSPGLPLAEALRRITGLAQPVVAEPVMSEAGAGASGRLFGLGGATRREGQLRPVASYMKDYGSLLVRLHDEQLAGVLGIPATSYSTAHVPPELQPKYEVTPADIEGLVKDASARLTRFLPKKMIAEECEVAVDSCTAAATGVPLRHQVANVDVHAAGGHGGASAPGSMHAPLPPTAASNTTVAAATGPP